MNNQYISELSEKVSDYYQNLFQIAPRMARYQELCSKEWINLCERLNLSSDREGVFLPRSMFAYINIESEYSPLSLFHELYGHGLFFEYTKRGRFLKQLEMRLLKEEKLSLKNKKSFSLRELEEFRKQSSNFLLLEEASQQNLELVEAFAVWTEKYLADIFCFSDLFKVKYKQMPKQLEENVAKLDAFQEKYGEQALFYELGFPKYYTIKSLSQMLIRLSGDNIKKESICLVYGSKKPYSDIDIFAISRKPLNNSVKWIDLYGMTPGQFEYRLSLFDISVTGPIMTGEIVFGNERWLEDKRVKLLNQSITNEAIYYNIIKSKEQFILANEFPKNSPGYARGMSYADTYMKNALALKQGRRLLTRSKLIQSTL